MGYHSFGRIGVFLFIKTVVASKVGYSAFGRHPRAAKKDNVFAFVNDFLKLAFNNITPNIYQNKMNDLVILYHVNKTNNSKRNSKCQVKFTK